MGLLFVVKGMGPSRSVPIMSNNYIIQYSYIHVHCKMFMSRKFS